MNLDIYKNELQKFWALLEDYFYQAYGTKEFPYFIRIFSINFINDHQNAIRAWKELKPILDQKLEEMNSKNDILISLLEQRYASSGITIADETYQTVITNLVTWNFNLTGTWNYIDSQLVKLGPEGFNLQCRRFYELIDKLTDDMINNME